jgi:hypothetical protein
METQFIQITEKLRLINITNDKTFICGIKANEIEINKGFPNQ